MRITSAGNVGIGTASPGVKLDVTGADARIRTASGAAQLNIGEWDGATHRIEGDANRDLLITSYASLLRLGMSGSTHLAIKSDGNVGIGTASPGALLQAGGCAVGAGCLRVDAQGVIRHFYQSEAQPRFIIDRDLISSQGGIGFGPGGGTTVAAEGSAVGQTTNRTLAFFTSNGTNLTERMRIDSAGNVGIGTAGPGADLDVAGTSYPGDPGRIRLTESPGSSIGLDLYVGTATGSTDGNAACQRYSANAVCLAYWSSAGVISSCGTVQGNGRALCADFP